MSDLSLESRMAMMSPEDRELALQGVDVAGLLWDWRFRGRPSQLEAYDSEASVILNSGGRGSGKTRGGAEWIRKKVKESGSSNSKLRIGLVARTAADVRDVQIQGESGLLAVFPPSEEPRYVSTARKVVFHNGAEALCFSAEEPSQLRGPQFHCTWADEIAAWDLRPDEVGLTAWDQVRIATRLGMHPQVFATTTPRRIKLMRDLYELAAAGDRVSLHTSTTFDNPYLAAEYRDMLIGLYAGSRLGAQELLAQLLGEIEGALWDLDRIEEQRLALPTDQKLLTVVGVDPSVSEHPKDECGIVVVSSTREPQRYRRRCWVRDDRTVLGPPSKWAKRVVDTARKYDCPVIAESNQGGEMVRDVIHSADPSIKVHLVHSKVGKVLRAEPVTVAYDVGRVHHVKVFPELEDQMTTWIPSDSAGNVSRESPDRVDALVHAVTALAISQAKSPRLGATQVTSPGRLGRVAIGARSMIGRG